MHQISATRTAFEEPASPFWTKRWLVTPNATMSRNVQMNCEADLAFFGLLRFRMHMEV